MNKEKYPSALESLLTKYGYTQTIIDLDCNKTMNKNLHIWQKPYHQSGNTSYYEVLVPLHTDWSDFNDTLDKIATTLSVSEDWSKQAILLDMKEAME